MKNQMKAIYTTPTLIEYGSLAERTKVFGLMNPDALQPDAFLLTSGTSII